MTTELRPPARPADRDGHRPSRRRRAPPTPIGVRCRPAPVPTAVAPDATTPRCTGRIEIDRPQRLLRGVPGGPRHLAHGQAPRDHRDHRSVRLRQEHVPADAQPDARADARDAGSRARSDSTARTSTARSVDPVALRRVVGMVFQRPNPFPTMSIYDNVAAGLRLTGRRRGAELDEVVERSPPARGAVGRGQGQAQVRAGPRCRAGSNSGCASRARSRSIPRSS